MREFYKGWLLIVTLYTALCLLVVGAYAEEKWKETVAIQVWCYDVSVFDAMAEMSQNGDESEAAQIAVTAIRLGVCDSFQLGVPFHPEKIVKEYNNFGEDSVVVFVGKVDMIEKDVYVVVPVKLLHEFQVSSGKVRHQTL